MSQVKDIDVQGWEDFDGEALFPPPSIHTNKLTKVDKKDMNYVSPDELGEDSSAGSEPSDGSQDGDSYTDAQDDKGYVDDMFEMDGLNGGSDSEQKDVRADKEEDQRTEKPEADSSDDADGEVEGEPSGESKPTEPDSEAQAEDEEKEGAEKPIQKESEGVEEVAEATSKTSEDVHGGDEVTKDIEDSPNAADNGMNEENHGAEEGKGGEDGEGEEGHGEGEEAGDGQGEDGGENGNGQGQGETSSSDENGEISEGTGDPLSEEDWENQADHSATALQLENELEELEAKMRNETGHRTSLPSYDFNRENSPAELETAFQKGRELIQKMAAEEDLTSRKEGSQRWDAKTICRNMVSYKHSRIPSSRYERPREADIKILLDISGSCAAQAEMFMAIAAGAIGNGVEIYVGYNGSSRAAAMRVPKRLPRSYKQAKAWVQQEIDRVSGWENQEAIGEWNFDEFVEESKPKTCIIFGDWDGIDQYQETVHKSKHRSVKFFWFCNEGYGWRAENADQIPEKWNKKTYFPGIYNPKDLVKALRKIR